MYFVCRHLRQHYRQFQLSKFHSKTTVEPPLPPPPVKGSGRMPLDALPEYVTRVLQPSMPHQRQLDLLREMYSDGKTSDNQNVPFVLNSSPLDKDGPAQGTGLRQSPPLKKLNSQNLHPDNPVAPTTNATTIQAVVDRSNWPFCALGLWLPGVSIACEGPGEEGFSTAYTRLSQSCTMKKTSSEWTNFWCSLSTSLTVLPSRDGLFIGCLVSADNVPKALEALLEIIFFPATQLDSHHGQINQLREIEKRQMIENAPDQFLQELCYLQMFGGSRIGNSIFAHSPGSDPSSSTYESFCRRVQERIFIGVSGGLMTPLHFQTFLEEALSVLGQTDFSLFGSSSVNSLGIGPNYSTESVSQTTANNPYSNQSHIPTADSFVLRRGSVNPNPTPDTWASVASGPLFIEDACFGESLALASANRWTGKTHFLIALPTGPATCLNTAMIPQAITTAMLGGGSSFSAGGPGKGLYSRLYNDLLNRHAWIDDAHSLFQSHVSGGWLGIYAAVERPWAEAALIACIKQLLRLHLNISEMSWKRAKNRLKSSLLMGIESRLSALETLLRTHSMVSSTSNIQQGNYQIEHLLQAIDSFSIEDLKTFRNRLIGNARIFPTLVAAGEDLSTFPSYPTALSILEEHRFTTRGQ